MAIVTRTPAARRDIDKIWDYIARHNLDAAERFIDQLDETFKGLAGMPMSGRARRELGPDCRSVPVGNYIVIYRPTSRGVQIMRVIHGARDLRSLDDLN